MNWYCPNCPTVDQTGPVQNRFHACPALHGLIAPLVLEGTKAKVETHEREDYIGSERVQLSPDGRPVMSITTEREDGQDVMVFAPTAHARST